MPKEEMIGPDAGGDIGFTPITSQEQLDEVLKNRLARARESWEKSGGSEKPVLDKPLSREDIERMFAEQLKEPSMMEGWTGGLADSGSIPGNRCRG